MSTLRRTAPEALTHYSRRLVAESRGAADRALHRLGLRTARGLRLPDFLGIGAQKAGSTWLYENLSRHPQLFLAAGKELHHFDWHRTPTLRSYASFFADAGDRLAGEITPGYSALSSRRVRWVRHVLPEVRVLLIVRDPVDRAWSQLVMDVRRDGRSPTTLTADEVRRRVSQRGARRRSSPIETIARWRAEFGDQLWVGRYEDLTERPEALLRAVLRHLGVDNAIDMAGWPLAARFNAGSGDDPPTEVREVLEEQFGEQRKRIVGLVPRLGSTDPTA